MYVSMKGMLERANQGNYAVMAINCFNIETTRACIEAAQSLRAPIIINIVQEHMVNHCDSDLIAPIVKKLANRASVEVALNFDHGQEVPLLKKALHDGYSSVMVDASRYDLEGNIIDALAVSYGSSHGNYPEGYVPEFDFERLKEIKELTKMPLVLHGGSGSGDENILKSVKYGINKINVGCDFMNANTEAIKKHLAADPDINFWVMMHQVEKESQELVKHYIRLSGSEGKSL